MLTNMLIYLAVVVFVFNLLDPSKIDASYVAKRGFTAQPEAEREEDKAFRRLSEQKREEQKKTQTEVVDSSILGPKNEPSPATRLSAMKPPNLASSRPDEPAKPKAALTGGSLRAGVPSARTAQSSVRTGSTSARTTQSRLYSIAIYPQATLPQSYSPIRLPVPQILLPEKYETLPVELAPGIDFPLFGLPRADNTGAYLYTPPKPVPDPVRGERKVSSPPVGAQSLYTNGTEKAKEPPPVKDKL